MQHLQLLGVKYFMAETPQVEQEAAVDPDLQLVAKSGPWTYNYSGADTTTTWQIYLVKDSALVTPLANDPVVLSGVKAGPASWLGSATHEGPSLTWYGDPSKWNVELAQSGPSGWPRTPVSDVQPTVKHVGKTKVSAVTQTDSSLSFHVSRVGTPVLVKVSYFPNWHASGADGPYRVTPNLMVVVPTSHDVTLSYGASTANHLGQLATLIGLVALVVMFVVPRGDGGAGGEPEPGRRTAGAPQRPPQIRGPDWAHTGNAAATVRNTKNRKCLICLVMTITLQEAPPTRSVGPPGRAPSTPPKSGS